MKGVPMAEHYASTAVVIRGPELQVESRTYHALGHESRRTDLCVGPLTLLGLHPAQLVQIRDECKFALNCEVEVPA